jgi:hypothetical protein
VLHPDEAPPGYPDPLETLNYGSSIRVGRIVCMSRLEGLTCTNPEGHGFFLSRQRVKLF